MSKLLHILNVRPGINSGIAVRGWPTQALLWLEWGVPKNQTHQFFKYLSNQGGVAHPYAGFVFPSHTGRGCPILAFFARVGVDDTEATLLFPLLGVIVVFHYMNTPPPTLSHETRKSLP
jgi:hypothetical protein